jgi:hypothetical protein
MLYELSPTEERRKSQPSTTLHMIGYRLRSVENDMQSHRDFVYGSVSRDVRESSE